MYKLTKKTDIPAISYIKLPASKSESNRVLILQALFSFFQKDDRNIALKPILRNISAANDTVVMQNLLEKIARNQTTPNPSLESRGVLSPSLQGGARGGFNFENLILDTQDAGTTFRFLTAFCVATRTYATLTGTPRMQERPIGILVDALRELGADIEYLQKDGFPPIQIKYFKQKTNQITLKADVSSQFISALLMIAPTLSNGLTINLIGKISSKPYIMMTLAQMQHFGIKNTYNIDNQSIRILYQKYKMWDFWIENDWSAASYWYLVASLCPNKAFIINGLKEISLQGDSKIIEIMQLFGVETIFFENSIEIRTTPSPSFEGEEQTPLLTKEGLEVVSNPIFIDFSDCPDLAQTIVALCAIKRITLKMSGLESLIIKETNRIEALNNEINKIGCKLCKEDNYWYVKPILDFKGDFSNIVFNTYDDHRMAMAFAPLALVLDNISIENPSVVRKSYPNFWEELEKVCFFDHIDT